MLTLLLPIWCLQPNPIVPAIPSSTSPWSLLFPYLWNLDFISGKKCLDVPVTPACYLQQDNELQNLRTLGLKIFEMHKTLLQVPEKSFGTQKAKNCPLRPLVQLWCPFSEASGMELSSGFGWGTGSQQKYWLTILKYLFSELQKLTFKSTSPFGCPDSWLISVCLTST